MAVRVNMFQPVKYNPGRHSFAGTFVGTGKRGLILTRHATSKDVLILANGVSGFFATRDIVADNDALQAFVEADSLRPNKGGFQSPFVSGGAVQVEDYEEVWVEGTDLLDASMDVNTAVNTQVTTANGKFSERTSLTTMEGIAIVKQNIPAINTDAPARRFLLQIIRTPKGVAAA